MFVFIARYTNHTLSLPATCIRQQDLVEENCQTLNESSYQDIKPTRKLTFFELDDPDRYGMDGKDFQNECSKIEYMAQKQNRVEQKLLNDRLLDIEKEVTLSQLAHRMLVKQLR